jgi:hypothetical protein
MRYRAEAASVEGFVQQIACCYLRHGYWFYVTGVVPASKVPEEVDRKLIAKYGIGVSESTRARRKRLGRANLQYLRHDRLFVIMATKGQHEFFEAESKSIHDIRHCPLRYRGYALSYRRGGRTRSGQKDPKWHAHVEIDRRRYLELKAWFLDMATHRSADNLALEFYRLPFEPYAPVRRQLLNLLRAVNSTRRKAGFKPVPLEVLPLRRRIVRPFVETGSPTRTIACAHSITSERPGAESNCAAESIARVGDASSGTNAALNSSDFNPPLPAADTEIPHGLSD